jgi:pimeloyl-ACP methyl ester carboxylesterase
MGFESLTVPVRGGEIFATRRDGDGPPALLLHGGPGVGAEYMVGLIEALDGVFETALPQQRGLEPSTLEGPRDVETHVADAIAVLDQLGWQRAWLVGHAWGGHLAMHVAVAHPDRVAGLILFETLGAVPDGGAVALVEAMVVRLSPEERAQLDALIARQTAGDEDPTLVGQILMTLWPSYGFVHGTLPPPVSLRLEESIPGEPDTMASVRAHFEAGTLEQGLPKLSLPALLIHGAGDPMPLTATTDTAALIPGATVEIIEEAGHFPWVEQPAAVRAVVEGFLTSHGAPRSD